MGAAQTLSMLVNGCCFENGSAAAVEEAPQTRMPCRSALENVLMLAEQSDTVLFPGAGDLDEDNDCMDPEESFSEWGSFRQALVRGDTVLVKASWVQRMYDSGGVLPRRQDLPAGAAWGVEELKQCFQDPGRQGPLVIAVSYSWLSNHHADPDGFHLRTIGTLLRQFSSRHGVSIDRVAMFIDWCSLPQEPRSESDFATYRRALEHVSLWYVHRNTEVWLLSRVPHAEVPYCARGWTSFEEALCSLIKAPDTVLDFGRLPIHIYSDPHRYSWQDVLRGCRARRKPPVQPEFFSADLLCKKFSVLTDRDFVSLAYRKAFHQVLCCSEQLSYARSEWGDREANQLAGILHLCEHLQELDLRGNDISGDGATALARALPRCKTLTRLCLCGNPIGDHSKRELREMWLQAGKNEAGLELEEPVFTFPLGARTSFELPLEQSFTWTSSVWAPEATPQVPETSSRDPEATPQVPEDAPVPVEVMCSQQLAQLLERQQAFESRVEAAVLKLSDSVAQAKLTLADNLTDALEAMAERRAPPRQPEPPSCADCFRAALAWATRGTLGHQAGYAALRA